MVRVCALQAHAVLSAQDSALVRETIAFLEQATSMGSPEIKRRGRKLLLQMAKQRRYEERKGT